MVTVQAMQDCHYLETTRKSMTEDVPMMESTLLILVVPIKNHSKFIAPINLLFSREEWMDLRILLNAGMTMFRALIGTICMWRILAGIGQNPLPHYKNYQN